MNNSYVIENGEVFVSNQYGHLFRRVYDDKIEEILYQENILETMQNEMKDIEENYININKFSKILINTRLPLMTILGITMFGFMMTLPSGVSTKPVLDIAINTFAFVCSSFIGVFGDIVRHEMKKKMINKTKRYEVLKELEPKQMSKIKSLKQEYNRKYNKRSVEVTDLDHKKEVEEINLMVKDYIENNNLSNNAVENNGKVRKLIK